MKRTKVERLAEELARVHDPGWAEWAAKGPGRFDHWKRLARHVLKRERKARGRTVGWTYLDPKFPTPIRDHHAQVVFDVSDKPWPDDNYRLVIVPREKRRAR